MTTVPVPICYSCANLYDTEGDARLRCMAYPEAIPEEILDSEVDHRLPYTGDHGITFDQAPDRFPPDWSIFEGEQPP